MIGWHYQIHRVLKKQDLDYNELFRLSILYKLGPNLAIFSSLFSEYFDCDKLINNIDSRYKFDKAFIDKIMKLMIFNSSSRSSIMLFRNKIIKYGQKRGGKFQNISNRSSYVLFCFIIIIIIYNSSIVVVVVVS